MEWLFTHEPAVTWSVYDCNSIEYSEDTIGASTGNWFPVDYDGVLGSSFLMPDTPGVNASLNKPQVASGVKSTYIPYLNTGTFPNYPFENDQSFGIRGFGGVHSESGFGIVASPHNPSLASSPEALDLTVKSAGTDLSTLGDDAAAHGIPLIPRPETRYKRATYVYVI